MSQYRPRTALILGGIRSGKSEFAESLIDDAPIVRYVATGRDPGTASESETRRTMTGPTGSPAPPAPAGTLDHRGGRRGPGRSDHPDRRRQAGRHAARRRHRKLDRVAVQHRHHARPSQALADAVAASPARIMIVSPEVGLSVVPGDTGRPAVRGRQRRAPTAPSPTVCDGVALVIAGQATWLKADKAGRVRDTGTEVVATATAAITAVAVEATTAAGSTNPTPTSRRCRSACGCRSRTRPQPVRRSTGSAGSPVPGVGPGHTGADRDVPGRRPGHQPACSRCARSGWWRSAPSTTAPSPTGDERGRVGRPGRGTRTGTGPLAAARRERGRRDDRAGTGRRRSGRARSRPSDAIDPRTR